MHSDSVRDINTLALYLAHEQIQSLREPVECVVLCGSAILNCAEFVFRALQANPDGFQTLVICGGIGHSTELLYDTVAIQYPSLEQEVLGLPEARVLHEIYKRFYKPVSSQCQIIIEDRSTNCGANAVETKRVLEGHGLCPKEIVIVQDPTMSLRTLASFKKAYHGSANVPNFLTCPTFVPKVVWSDGQMNYDIDGVDSRGLWNIPRFIDLILGEIPRLRDDVEGYGPLGKGFIAHVDIPLPVEEAWSRLNKLITPQRVKDVRS